MMLLLLMMMMMAHRDQDDAFYDAANEAGRRSGAPHVPMRMRDGHILIHISLKTT
jgi:hypothetical protein